jgi:hypothetical protein
LYSAASHNSRLLLLVLLLLLVHSTASHNSRLVLLLLLLLHAVHLLLHLHCLMLLLVLVRGTTTHAVPRTICHRAAEAWMTRKTCMHACPRRIQSPVHALHAVTSHVLLHHFGGRLLWLSLLRLLGREFVGALHVFFPPNAMHLTIEATRKTISLH